MHMVLCLWSSMQEKLLHNSRLRKHHISRCRIRLIPLPEMKFICKDQVPDQPDLDIRMIYALHVTQQHDSQQPS